MKYDLYQICMDTGMTEEEFIIELRRSFAAYMSVLLEENPDKNVIKYTANFTDHDIIVSAHRYPQDANKTVNGLVMMRIIE